MNMKKLLATILAISISAFALTASADVYVKGYTKKDGTYVAPHYRSSPNKTQSDNYSSKGNYNPHTGKKGKNNPKK